MAQVERPEEDEDESGVDSPGRKHDFPYKAVVTVSMICFCNAYGTCYLFSFVGFMVIDFHAANNRDEAGYYAGYVASAFMLGRVASSLFWGWFSDKCGRKPALLIGCLSVAVFSLCFGLVSSLTGALVVRFLAGLTNGVTSVSKTIASEIGGGEYATYILSVVIGSWSLGLILGPSVSGVLARPADLYPAYFPPGSLFEVKPYLLTSLVPTAIGILSSILTVLWLPETLKTDDRSGVAYKVVAASEEELEDGKTNKAFGAAASPLEIEDGPGPEEDTKEEVFEFTREFVVVNALYCSLSFIQIMIDEVVPLWVMSTPAKGGLNMSLAQIGALLAFGGWLMLIYQFLCFPRIAGKLRLTTIFPVSCLILSMQLFTEPLVVSGLYNPNTIAWSWALYVLNGTRVAITSGAFTAICQMSNNAVRMKFRGRANGVAMGVASIFKMLGPSVGGVLYAASINSTVLNFYFPFAFTGVAACITAGLSLKFLPSTSSVNEAID